MEPGILVQIATETGLSQDVLNAALWRHAEVNKQKGYETLVDGWSILAWEENDKLEWACVHALQVESRGDN
jgi:hypothetical protein